MNNDRFDELDDLEDEGWIVREIGNLALVIIAIPIVIGLVLLLLWLL